MLGDIGLTRLEFAVIGSTVNAASRLEALTRALDCALVASDDLVNRAKTELGSADAAFRSAGEGKIKAYPERLPSLLQVPYPNAKITMVNQGIGGQEAPTELERFDKDVIAEKPDLVIWQVGTNAVWQSPDTKPPPFSFDETKTAIRDGLIKLRKETRADVILMDLQYVPALLTPSKKQTALKMVEAISKLAKDAKGVNVFRRFAFMKALYRIEQVSFDRMVDPGMTPDCTKATGLPIVWRER